MPLKPLTSKKAIVVPVDCVIHQQAFDNSLQANILTTASTGKIIIANRAACKLLGYSKKMLLTKTRSIIFDIKETSFKKMLKERSAEGNSIATVTAIKKNGKRIPCEITSAVFMGEDGIEKAITTIADMTLHIKAQKLIDLQNEKIVAGNISMAKSKQKSIDTKNKETVAGNIIIAHIKQQNVDIKKDKIVADNIVLAKEESDAMLAANNRWIKHIAKTSYDVMWDWNIISGEIYVGDSLLEVFGYKVKNNTVHFKDFSRCLLKTEKNAIEKKLSNTLLLQTKTWRDSFMFRRSDGSIAAVISRASIVRDEQGKAIRMIGAVQDISRLQELEKKLEAQITLQLEDSQKFQLASKLSFDVIWDWNLLTNEVFIGEGFKELFGYEIKNNSGHISNFTNHIHPEDRKIVEQEIQRAILSSAVNWEHVFRFIRSDGSVAKVFKRASIIRDANGKAFRIIGVLHDLSSQNELEENLENEIKLKEKQIEAATAEAKETERSDIGKELHDNINQLLGASKLYLDTARRGGPESELCLSRSSEYTLMAIEAIRALTKGLTTDTIKEFGICEAIENIARETMQMSEVKISTSLNTVIENKINNKFKLNLFRIIQEQLTNILKHAGATKISIKIVENKTNIILIITDNGKGFDTLKKQKGIGLANIKSRALFYNGIAEFASQPAMGCVVTVKFPVSDLISAAN